MYGVNNENKKDCTGSPFLLHKLRFIEESEESITDAVPVIGCLPDKLQFVFLDIKKKQSYNFLNCKFK